MTVILKRRTQIWLLLYLVCLAVLTLSPFDFSIDYLISSDSRKLMDLIIRYIYFDGYDMVANFILLLPFGFIYYYLSRHALKAGSWGRAFFMGGILSFGIEFTQLFLERSSNITDIVMNALGSAAGFILAGCYQRFHDNHQDLICRFDRWFRGLVLTVYGVFVILLFLLPRYCTTPDSWNPDFHLLIGNEASMDRPWRGELQWIALYNQSLTQHQVRTLNQSHLNDRSVDIRKNMGLLAAYPLTEGAGDTLHDRSGYQNPLLLCGSDIQWSPGGGIQCRGGLIQSVSPGFKMTHAVKQSGAFSVEVWCTPDNLIQGGPARIVSLSPNAGQRNFTLAQQEKQIRLRFRSQMGGWNGSDINLRANHVLDSLGQYHLIATYHHGVEQLFVNGRRHPDVIYGHIHYLPAMLGLGKSELAQFSLIAVLLFPLSVLAASLCRCRGSLIITIIFMLALVLGIDLFYVWSYHAPLCKPLLMTGLITAVTGWVFIRLVTASEK